MKKLSITVLPDRYSIVRFAPDLAAPTTLIEPVKRRQLLSISRTDRELSIVCPTSVAPSSTDRSDDWACLEVDGPLDFSETGILARLSDRIAASDISIFAVSTYDTDYILVAASDLQSTIDVLEGDGIAVAQV